MTEETKYTKKSISIPTRVLADVQERVGRRGFSAYVTEALERKLQRDALDDILAEAEAQNGPVDEAKVQEIMQRLAS